MEIILRPGEIYTWTAKNGTTHTISVTRFLEHNHEQLPVYYLDFPLSQEDLHEEKGNLVLSMLGFGFSKPYTGTLGATQTWDFTNCPLGELYLERADEREEITVHFSPIL